MKRYLPDLLTLLNLMCGVCACIMATWGLFTQAYCFVLAGAIFDIFDGALARRLGVSSPVGRELDSLSDLISFGLAPALMMFTWYYKINCDNTPHILAFVPLLIVPFSAVRLARFNVYDSGEKEFRGLATSANGMLISSIMGYGHSCAVAGAESIVVNLLRTPWFIPVAAAVLCILLVSTIRMFSVKGKSPVKHIVFAVCAALIIIYDVVAGPREISFAGHIALFTMLLFCCYILVSILVPEKH